MTKKLIEFIRLNQTIKTIIDDKSLSLEPLFSSGCWESSKNWSRILPILK